MQKQTDFYQLIEKTVEVSKKFSTQYSKQDRVMDLMEELGELSQAVLVVEKKKITNNPNKQKTTADIADALADMLYAMIMLADQYQIDLPAEYEQVLEQFQKRIAKGEFTPKSI